MILSTVNSFKGVTTWNLYTVFLFVWFDSLRPINNLSVKKGRVFLGWTSTKLGLMFLLNDTTQWHRWGLNPRPFGLQSSALPLSHCAPCIRCVSCLLLVLMWMIWHFSRWNLNIFHFLFYLYKARIMCNNGLIMHQLHSWWACTAGSPQQRGRDQRLWQIQGNNSGPRTVPCGTPEMTSACWETAPIQ